ncbi:MAG: HIT domain-containing protein [Anaerolineaceae bacterium]|nr:HIT domain-containing protein [Anaerolineaceae bacterium]
MKHLWSPWRMKYIRRKKAPKGCVFCSAAQQEDSEDNLIVARGEHAFVILNRYPYTSGHIMIVPFDHVDTFNKMDKETCAEIMSLIRQGISVLDHVYQPDGYNMGANLGASAGAGITNHIHFHLVPRWGGDTNYMTSIGNARVLPEDLSETFRRLKDAWPKFRESK